MTTNLVQLLHFFLAILLAYVLTDVLFQSSYLPIGEKKPLRKYTRRGLSHSLILFLVFAVFDPQALRLSTMPWAIVYLFVDTAIDFTLNRAPSLDVKIPPGWTYIAGMFLHLCAVTAFAIVLGNVDSETIGAIGAFINSTRDKALSAVTLYVGTMFGGGFLIRQLTQAFKDHVRRSEGENGELPNAGMYIGWLERLLIITAVLIQSPTMIGLMLTGKSIARYPEMKNAGFAEYYLIGTFLSITIAIAGGMLIQLCWNGTVKFN